MARQHTKIAVTARDHDHVGPLGGQTPLRQDELEGDVRHLTKQMQQAWILKRAEQPLLDQRAALLFKSPGGLTAASLIQDAGLARTQAGDVMLSERNANFAVAGPSATSRDVLDLIDMVRKGVAERTGVELELALEVW